MFDIDFPTMVIYSLIFARQGFSVYSAPHKLSRVDQKTMASGDGFLLTSYVSRRCHTARIFCRSLCLSGLDLDLDLDLEPIEKSSNLKCKKNCFWLKHWVIKNFNLIYLKPKMKELHLQEKKTLLTWCYIIMYPFNVYCLVYKANSIIYWRCYSMHINAHIKNTMKLNNRRIYI